MTLFWIGLGGAAGAIARYLTYLGVRAHSSGSFPWATLTVNVLGCLAAGVLITLLERQLPFQRQLILMGMTGFLGAYTTFSAFGVETLQLLDMGQPLRAIASVGANVVFGLGAVWLGRLLSQSLLG